MKFSNLHKAVLRKHLISESRQLIHFGLIGNLAVTEQALSILSV